MKPAPKLGAKLVIIPHDGTSNSGNPYDCFTPDEREEKTLELCARIYLRMRSKDAVSASFQPGTSVSGTPAADASGPQSEPEDAGGAR